MLVALTRAFNSIETNQSTPATSPGTSVTPGASNTKGSWTSLLTLTGDCHLLEVVFSGGATSANSKQHLADIGYDPAGGTSFTVLIPDIVCGNSGTGRGKSFVFPIRIPAGSSIGCRIQGSNATAGTVFVQVVARGKPTRPELTRSGRVGETIGLGTSSRGTIITPGVSGAEGSWTSLGTTSKRLWWFQLGMQIDDASSNSQVVFVDLAYGDATNKHIILQNAVLFLIGTNEIEIMFPQVEGACEVPAGATLYARASTTLATADTNFNCAAHGIGG